MSELAAQPGCMGSLHVVGSTSTCCLERRPGVAAGPCQISWVTLTFCLPLPSPHRLDRPAPDEPYPAQGLWADGISLRSSCHPLLEGPGTAPRPGGQLPTASCLHRDLLRPIHDRQGGARGCSHSPRARRAGGRAPCPQEANQLAAWDYGPTSSTLLIYS